MRILFFLFFLSVSFQMLYAKDSENICKKDFSKYKIEIADSLDNLQNIINKELNNKSKTISELELKLEDSKNTISFLNSVIGTFSAFLTGLGIFIAIIALIVPFATYHYAVKPSREALKDLEKNFDNRLEQYLWENRNNQINKAIEKIKDGNAEEKSQAISFLSFTQSEGLTDEQLFQIYRLLKKNQADYSIKSQLSFILSSRRTDYASELFNSSDVKDDPVIRQMAMLYYAKTGYKNNYKGLNSIISEKNNQDINFNSFIGNLHLYNSSDVAEAICDNKLIDILSKETLTKLKKSFPNYIKSLGLNVDFENSYLNDRIKNNA